MITPAAAGDPTLVAGPVEAEVVAVRDGDTIAVRARVWPGHLVVRDVRLRGVDTPELRGACEAERQQALEAKTFAETVVGDSVRLANIEDGKYAGRVVADVLTGSGDLAALLVESGHGRAYGGGRRQSWCE